MNTKKKVYWIVKTAAVTVVGLLVMPPLMKKLGNKLYKHSLKKDEIDYENMEPEIVKKDKSAEE